MHESDETVLRRLREAAGLPADGLPESVPAPVFDGTALRRLRRGAGLSTEQLAVMVGRSYNSLRLYEQNRVIPPAPVLMRLASALKCEPADLFHAEAAAAS